MSTFKLSLPSIFTNRLPIMGLVDRYLFSHIVTGSLMVVLVLASLDTFFAFLSEVDTVGRGTYDYFKVFLYLLYSLPMRIYNYAPTAVLLGSLISLGGMASRGELVAIRAAGKSISGIVLSVLKAGFVLTVLIFMLGEWVAPEGEKVAEQLRSRAISSQQAVSTGEELWVRNGDKFIHVQGVLDDRRLLGITVYGFEGLHLTEMVKAASAKGIEGSGWDVKDINRMTFSEDQVSRSHASSEYWGELVDDSLFGVLNISEREMSASSLRTYVSYMQENGLDSKKYELAFWNRFTTPLSTLVMLMLALPFVFSSQRTGGAGQQIFIGIMLGIGYFLASTLFNRLGLVYGIPPFFSSILPPFFFLILGIVLLRRVV